MSDHAGRLSNWALTYIALVAAAGICAVVTSAYDLIARPLEPEWLILAGLTLFTGAFSIKLPSVNARISVSEAFVFAAVLLFGPSAATIIVALDTIVLTSWPRRARRSRVRALFNICAGTTAIWLSAHLFRLLSPQTPVEPQLEQLLFPSLVLAASYFLINSSLVAIAVSCEGPMSPLSVWKDNFAWIGLNYLGGASVAMLLASYRQSIDLAALSVIVPLLLITYLTVRSSLGRLADAHQHISQVNELYLSTIETLAMAVDAKDQITHGHIRRVQVYAIELAKRLGVREHAQLKAIEAAALLHDMGKLAIPEHILNKPGKLTAAEFETMKRHAAIGADLLSEIRFPYPVVPIVRHHHENWNGGGYPTGISGADIPLGARILSVVDCFDALNSDRPYRPRLRLDEAFAILRERSGTMYDPWVVENFIAAFPDIVGLADAAGQRARTLGPALGDAAATPLGPLEEIRSAAADGAILAAARAQIMREDSESGAMAVLSQHVRLLTPSAACAYFRYAANADELVCEYVGSELYNPVLDLRIRPGERVTGWVAANHQTISNSDAKLDLGETASLVEPTPRSAISTPVVNGRAGVLYGVLTGYSPKVDAFDVRHTYVFEQLAEAFGHYLAVAQGKDSNLVRFQRRG